MAQYHLRILLFIFFLGSSGAHATFVDFNALYYSDQFKTSTSSTIAHSAWDFGVGYRIGSAKRFAVALNFGGASMTEKTTTTIKLVNSDTGLKLFYLLNRDKTLSTSVTYNFIAKAKYNDGTSNVELRGTSLKADLSYHVWLWENSAFSIKLIYYKPTFKESINSSTLTDVNYNRTTIAPGIGFLSLF